MTRRFSDIHLSTMAAILFIAAVAFFFRFDDRVRSVQAQGRLVWITLPDVTMTGSAVPISATGQSARLCQVTALTANAAVVRWGDSAITSSRGSFISAGGGQFIPPGGVGSSYAVDLTTTYVIGTAGDKVALTCAK